MNWNCSSKRGLSKGELRRVLTAVGLLTPQPLLLLDEPFDGLDLRQTREMMRVLRSELHGRTLFLSIHQLTDAARVCDRLIPIVRAVGEKFSAEVRHVTRAACTFAAAKREPPTTSSSMRAVNTDTAHLNDLADAHASAASR